MYEISTVGAKVGIGLETTNDVKPTAFYELPNVSEAPEVTLDVEALDCSDISDKITRYIVGRQDPGGTATFTLNHTDAVIAAWEEIASASETAYSNNLSMWIMYWLPNAEKAFYYKAIAVKLGSNGLSQNEVDTIPASVIVTDVVGWDDASTIGDAITTGTFS